MAVSNPYAQYQSNQVTTAGPDKLLLMAYDGAIRFAKIGCEKIKAGILDEKSINIGKSQAIIAELLMTLNPDAAPELVSNLANLYEYIFNRLTEANLNDDVRAADDVIGILSDLRDAWGQAAQMWREDSAGEERLAA
jgi:flagellar secretion chaperone FliS